jgi:hypothetical protein
MKPFHYNQDPLYAISASILQGHQLTEGVIAFKNLGFKQLNGLMSDDEIHRAVNSTIKRESLKLGDRTWKVVTDIYGRRDDGTWTGDWIMARKGGGAWLTTKDGGAFKAHDSISSVLSFFEMEEEVKVDEGVEDIVAAVANFKKGDKTNFGVVTDISSTSISFKAKDLPVTKIPFNQRKMGSKDFVLDKLVKLKEGVEDWEGENPPRWNPKERKELRAALESGKKLPYNEFRKLAHNYYKKSAKDHALNNLMTMSDQMTVDDVSRMFGMKLKLKDGKVFATKLKEGVEDFYSQKMIKNQLNTIVRNSTTCLNMIEAGREFPEWAQSEIAVAEDGIVSVTEFMESHQTALGEDSKLDEAQNMGTATIVDTGNKSGLDGKKVNIFHKFDDGRINIQYKQSDRKGDVRNLTLNKGQYKLNEAVTTTNIKKLIDDIDDLSKEEFKQFLLAFADHMDETSKYARTNTGASRESIKAVSTYLYSAAEAFKI